MNLLNTARLSTLAAAALATLATLATPAQADPVTANFADNFHSGLSGWNDRSPSNREAALFTDPLNAANKVLGFNRLGNAGSIFSKTIVVSPDSVFTLSFDYLGVPGRGVAGDLGGYIGVAASAYPDLGFWIGGTGLFPTPVRLVDDGQWHSYSYTFTSIIGNTLRVMAEDWAGSRGVAGDAFFDNVALRAGTPRNDVPEPGSLALVGAALVATISIARRRAKGNAG